jgi:Esterase-like activity of phytase
MKSTLYAIGDGVYKSNRIFVIDTSSFPAVIQSEIFVRDTNGVIQASLMPLGTGATEFSQIEILSLVNADFTVSLDLEGIAVSATGGFWLVNEGAGGNGLGTGDVAITSTNFLLKVTAAGVISAVYPYQVSAADNAMQSRFGFHGVAEDGNKVVVTFQRNLVGEGNPRIGIFDTVAKTWEFVLYPLAVATSQYSGRPANRGGSFVGLGDISPLGNMEFLVVERDNMAGLDASIKRLYKIDLKGYVNGATISKQLVRDLLPDLMKPKGQVPEKIEGLTVTKGGDVWIINDNDAVNNNSGETQLMNLGSLKAMLV